VNTGYLGYVALRPRLGSEAGFSFSLIHVYRLQMNDSSYTTPTTTRIQLDRSTGSQSVVVSHLDWILKMY